MLPDGNEHVFLGGGNSESCGIGDDGIEEYNVVDDKWALADRHNTFEASGPSVKVSWRKETNCKDFQG